MSSATIPANLLSAIPALDGKALKDLEALTLKAEQRELQRGEILVRQGEPSDALYFVLSGRFGVRVEGTLDPIAEIGQGQPIGEIGFFGAWLSDRVLVSVAVMLRSFSPSPLASRQGRSASGSCRSTNVPDVAVPYCTTKLENAHGTEFRELLYPWHPWFGLRVGVQARTRARGAYSNLCA
jgi:hypothetical protein